MKLLLTERGQIVAISNLVEYGVWGNLGNTKSWRIGTNSYTMDDNFTVVEVPDENIPTYVKEYEFYYVGGEFKLADECPNEYKDKMNQLEDDLLNTQLALAEQYESNISVENELLATQLALTEQYETNIALEESINSDKEEIALLKSEIAELKSLINN